MCLPTTRERAHLILVVDLVGPQVVKDLERIYVLDDSDRLGLQVPRSIRQPPLPHEGLDAQFLLVHGLPTCVSLQAVLYEFPTSGRFVRRRRRE